MLLSDYMDEAVILLLKMLNRNIQIPMYSRNFYVSRRLRKGIILKCKGGRLWDYDENRGVSRYRMYISQNEIRIRVVLRDNKIVQYRLKYKGDEYPIIIDDEMQIKLLRNRIVLGTNPVICSNGIYNYLHSNISNENICDNILLYMATLICTD